MNYETFAISRLKDYPAKKASLYNLRDEIVELRTRQTALKSTRFDHEVVQGRDLSRAQDMALNLIALIDEKSFLLRQNLQELTRMNRALSTLFPDEREVVDAFFLSPTRDPVQYLREKKGYERTWIYDRRRDGIRHFAKAFYGAVDT